ncbi:F-box protein [Actinidia chinensis var. chinensis]|uniref:F-box protein n=1 Tax=Actinidia chinensis var. chinensis TaxID=1590841 RepID=A0A2R6RHE2_ACTCC|nr:F-box protein [Actinidia chinensis var. chinensis]
MSDRVLEPYHDGDGRDGQSMNSYQSVWMAHWTRTSCGAAPRIHNCMSLHVDNNDDPDSKKHHLLSGLEIASDMSPSAEGFTEVTEAKTVGIMNEGLTSSKSVINERLDCQPFPMFRLCQDTSIALDPKNEQDISCHRVGSRPHIDCNVEYNDCKTKSRFPLVLAMAPPVTETSSSECQSRGVSQNPENLVTNTKVVGDGSLALAGPSQDNFTGPTQMVPYKVKSGKSPVLSSFMGRQEEFKQLNSLLASKEHLSSTNFTIFGQKHDNYPGHSALLVCEKKLDKQSTAVKCGTSFLRQGNASQLLKDPFAGIHHLPILGEECSQKMQSCSDTGFIPSCSNTPEAMKSERLYRGCYSMQRIPGSVHDTETMRICTTNSVEGLARGSGVFSQTTRSLLFMTQTDINLSKENQTSEESKLSTKRKRNMFAELLSLSPPLAQNQQRLKLQPLGNSTESKGKDNVEGGEPSEFCVKNESSAETDALDMDNFKEQNYLPGVNDSPSNKDILIGQNQPSQPTTASAGEEVGFRCSITRLPDINEEIPVLPAAGRSMDNAEPSTSRTQSLDAEHLLAHTEHPDDHPIVEPSRRWLKHFRLSVPDSLALGTKSSNLGETSSRERVDKLFSKIMKGSKSSNSKPTSHGKDKAIAQDAIVLGNGDSSSTESAKQGRDILLSHPWIQRWCHNRDATHQKKPEAVVVCEPLSTKMEFDELQNKQFPSIAAMALMGKAMSGFQQCEFQKRGSFVVWNTKNF